MLSTASAVVDRPVGRGGIDRRAARGRWAGRLRRATRRSKPAHRDERRSAASRAPETARRNRRHARPFRWRSRARCRSPAAIRQAPRRSARDCAAPPEPSGALPPRALRRSAVVGHLSGAPHQQPLARADTFRARVSVNMPSAKAMKRRSAARRRADVAAASPKIARAPSFDDDQRAIRNSIASGRRPLVERVGLADRRWMCIILPRCQPTAAPSAESDRANRHPAGGRKLTNIIDPATHEIDQRERPTASRA